VRVVSNEIGEEDRTRWQLDASNPRIRSAAEGA